jgi:probable rRNA maturation factor
MIRVDVTNRQRLLRIDRKRLAAAVRRALELAGRDRAEVSLAVVDNATIAQLHGQYLGDPSPTDVLSFLLESGPAGLEGEVIVSAETASDCAARFGWSPADELLLYAVHGTLHLAGYRDATAEQRNEMRKQERAVLKLFKLRPCYRARTTVHTASPALRK